MTGSGKLKILMFMATTKYMQEIHHKLIATDLFA